METEHIKETADDEISLIDLLAVIWQRRVMVIAIILTAMVGSVVFSIISLVLPPEKSPLPNYYTPEAHMLINDPSSSGGGLSSMMNSSGMGALAGLAGINVGNGPTTGDVAVYLMGANSLLDTVVDKFDLITRYKIKPKDPPRATSRMLLKKSLTGEIDEDSGVFTISFRDIDPVFAQEVVNFCVRYLEQRFNDLGLDKNKIEEANLRVNIDNSFKEIQKLERESQQLGASAARGGTIPVIALELSRLSMELEAQKQVYTQLKIQHELAKITLSSEKPTFQILEMADVLDQKSGPSRGLICIIVTFAAGFLAVFIAFVRNSIDHIKKDPEAMAKLRGTA